MLVLQAFGISSLPQPHGPKTGVSVPMSASLPSACHTHTLSVYTCVKNLNVLPVTRNIKGPKVFISVSLLEERNQDKNSAL